jgi:hypothetical protein
MAKTIAEPRDHMCTAQAPYAPLLVPHTPGQQEPQARLHTHLRHRHCVTHLERTWPCAASYQRGRNSMSWSDLG